MYYAGQNLNKYECQAFLCRECRIDVMRENMSTSIKIYVRATNELLLI